ncbi:recombinase family protein [Streptomyces sp. NPDC055036]
MVVLQHVAQSDMVVPIGMYRRVSIDQALRGVASSWRGVQEQVKEQDEALRAFVDTDLELKRRGAVIVRDYCDNDTPASDPHIVRDDFEALLRDLESGVIHGVVFLHADRLARLVYDAARVCRVFEMNPTYIGRSVEGNVDLSTVEGRAMFVMQATMGNMEIGNIKRRTKRTNARIARRGVMHSAARAFGWGEDRKTLHEEEAPFLLANIRAVPGGLKVGTFRKKLVDFGYVPQQQKNSRPEGVRQASHSVAEEILTNPRNAGFRLYVPQDTRRTSGRLWLPDFIVTDAKGMPVMGDWERACTVEEYWACVHEIQRRKEARREGNGGEVHDTRAKYLISGIARCGKCLTPMWANPYGKGTTSYEKWGFRYACMTIHGGCGGVTRCGPPCDDLVEEAFLTGTRTGLGEEIEKAAGKVDETVNDARIEDISTELEEVKQRRIEKRITTSAALDLIEELEKERKKLRSERGVLVQEKKKGELLSPDALSDWPNLSMAEKRVRLTQTIKSVIIHPIGRGKSFDPEFIEIVWREDTKDASKQPGIVTV